MQIGALFQAAFYCLIVKMYYGKDAIIYGYI